MNRSRKSLALHFGFAILVSLSICLIAFAADSSNVGGSWVFTNQAGRGSPATPATDGMVIQQNGNKIKGSLAAPRSGNSQLEGEMNGSSIRFTVKRHTEAGDVVIDYQGTVQGTSIRGTYRVRGQESGTDLHWAAERPKT